MEKAGVAVEVLGWKRLFDVAPFLALQAGCCSAGSRKWCMSGDSRALRALAVSGGAGRAKVFLSGVLPPDRSPEWLDRWLWGRERQIVALGEAEAVRYRQLGVPVQRLKVVWPRHGQGRVAAGSPRERGACRQRCRRVPGCCLTIGPFAAHKGFTASIRFWPLDILHYLYEDLHLVLAGIGTGAGERVLSFSQFLGVAGKIFTLPAPARASTKLPQRAECGLGVESCRGRRLYGAGAPWRPASRWPPLRLPGLAEIVVEGVTGYLVEPGDKPEPAAADSFAAGTSPSGRRQFRRRGTTACTGSF